MFPFNWSLEFTQLWFNFIYFSSYLNIINKSKWDQDILHVLHQIHLPYEDSMLFSTALHQQ